LFLSTILTISSSSWFSAWVGLEINLIRITPILINKISIQSSEASIKYFLIQAIASSILLVLVFFNYNTYISSVVNKFTDLVVALTLIIKIGAAPLHFWFPQILLHAGWPQCLILLRWQKVAPFILLSYFNNIIIPIAIIFSSLVGILGGINQTNIKIILAYSSIMHSSWMLSIIILHELLWGIYLSFYSLLIFSASIFFVKTNTLLINNIFSIGISSFFKIITLINFLSIAGLPPFIGFFIKIIALIALFKFQANFLVILLLISSSFISFYFYSRIVYSSLFIRNNFLTIWNTSTFLQYFSSSIFPILSLLGTLVFPILILPF